jgi:hypothetical protein
MCQVWIVRPAFRQVIVHILKEFSRSHSASEFILKFRSRERAAFLCHIEPERGANAGWINPKSRVSSSVFGGPP